MEAGDLPRRRVEGVGTFGRVESHGVKKDVDDLLGK